MEKIKPYLAFIIPIALIVIFVFAFSESSKEEQAFEFNYDGMESSDRKPPRPDNPLQQSSPSQNSATKTDPLPYNTLVNLEPNKSQYATLNTTEGKIKILLNYKDTPKTASNFWNLSEKNFYDNTIFHRVIKGFMIQGGDPQGNGSGGPGYKFEDEPFNGEYTRGTVAMANSGPNTNGSQFFIMHQDYPLPKNYVIFGQVVEGMDVVDKIANAKVTASLSGETSKPLVPVKVESTELTQE